LFHNNHDGTFTDVSAKAGVQNDRWVMAARLPTTDNDGWPDIYVNNYGKNRLYHNNHDGTFTDVAEKAGVTLGNWSPGSAWGDYDGDGLLDLYVTGYVHFDRDNLPIGAGQGGRVFLLPVSREAVNCGPRGLQWRADHLFAQQTATAPYTDVTVKAGVGDKAPLLRIHSRSLSVSKGTASRTWVVGNDFGAQASCISIRGTDLRG